MPTIVLLNPPRIFSPSYGPVSNHAQGNGFTGLFLHLCLSAVLSHSFALLYIHKLRFNPVLYLLCTVFCMNYLLIRLLYLWSGFKQPRLEQFKNVLASDLTLYLTR